MIQAKPISDDAFSTVDSKQVSKYLGKCSQVLVTNFRDFLLLGTEASYACEGYGVWKRGATCAA